jgi:hypothetical protein
MGLSGGAISPTREIPGDALRTNSNMGAVGEFGVIARALFATAMRVAFRRFERTVRGMLLSNGLISQARTRRKAANASAQRGRHSPELTNQCALCKTPRGKNYEYSDEARLGH